MSLLPAARSRSGPASFHPHSEENLSIRALAYLCPSIRQSLPQKGKSDLSVSICPSLHPSVRPSNLLANSSLG
ncbi:hypothetical protein ROHU_025181 [Labeo rohita]|uniref:Uncharacterized protein n=1 Tax=Labeo rohita TaxID=84645 RepID=A0A498MK09_LABRO|nr:hypothetical protein ROHU_025181 [Labeo rohita]